MPINVSVSTESKDVTFNIGHGKDDVTTKVGVGLKILPIDAPNVTGWTFEYWYKDDENTPYDFDNEIVSDDITLYAKYNANEYNIKYYLYGIQYTNVENDTRKYNEAKTLKTFTDDFNKGYTFRGWYALFFML